MTRPVAVVADDECRLHTIVMLLEDRFEILDLAGPLQVFSSADRDGSVYRSITASLHGGRICSAGGLAVETEALPAIDAYPIDTMIVIGGAAEGRCGSGVEAWLAAHSGAIPRLCGIGRGIRRLAGAALIADPVDSLHWSRSPTAARQAKQAPIASRHGAYWTCAGGTGAIDLAIELISEDLGEAAALAASEILLLPLRRRPEDPQVSATLAMQVRAGAPFAELFHWMRGNLAGDLRVDRLAARCNMSPRTFARRFAKATGATPAAAIAALRLEAAESMFGAGPLPLKEVAARCGFGSELNLRRALARRVRGR